jgi:hypothetical protein
MFDKGQRFEIIHSNALQFDKRRFNVRSLAVLPSCFIAVKSVCFLSAHPVQSSADIIPQFFLNEKFQYSAPLTTGSPLAQYSIVSFACQYFSSTLDMSPSF